MKEIKVVYIAGPYRSRLGARGVEQNIRRAEDLAYRVWTEGLVALCPHTNAKHFDGILPDEVFLKGDLELLKRCDAVLLVNGWRESAGTRAEITFAINQGIPVFEDLYELVKVASSKEQ